MKILPRQGVDLCENEDLSVGVDSVHLKLESNKILAERISKLLIYKLFL